MSLFGALGSGLSGLQASSAGIEVATHNVANATTPGFTRRELALGTATPIQRGGLWMGQGVSIVGIGRAGDSLLLGRLASTAGQAASTAFEHAALSGVEGLFEPTSGTSLRGAVDGLFDAFQAATADPADPGLRGQVVAAADTFARTVSGLARGLEASIGVRDESIAATVDQVNADLAQVAALNAQIRNGGGALGAGDLADQRDLAIGRLAAATGASAHFEPDGTATVLIGGHAAVSGDVARTMSFSADPEPKLGLSVDAGTVSVTDGIGGSIGGELSGRETIGSWLDEVDTLATDLSAALNAQNAAGFTRSGASGGPLFAMSGGASTLVSTATADGLAFAGSASGEAGDAGNLQAMIGLETASVVGGQPPGAYASKLTSRVGTETALAATRADAAESASLDAQEMHANLTSVDLDEQAVDLIQYQTAYQAAAKVVQVTDDLLGTLMQIVR